jgi:hypothetical protein
MKFDKQPFSASGDYDARKPFDFQGEHIARGARFEWRRLGCGARKLRQLWDNGFIVPAGSLNALPAAEPEPSGQTGTSEPSAEEKAKAEAEAKAKRVEAGKKAAEARKAKKAAEAAAPAPEPSAQEA